MGLLHWDSVVRPGMSGMKVHQVQGGLLRGCEEGDVPGGLPSALTHAFTHLWFVCFLRGNPEDPHRPLVISVQYAAHLCHHQCLVCAGHGAAHLHWLCLPTVKPYHYPKVGRKPRQDSLCIYSSAAPPSWLPTPSWSCDSPMCCEQGSKQRLD